MLAKLKLKLAGLAMMGTLMGHAGGGCEDEYLYTDFIGGFDGGYYDDDFFYEDEVFFFEDDFFW